MKIERITKPSKPALEDINRLLKQLVHDPATYVPVKFEKFQTMLKDRNTVVLAAKDGARVVGIALLVLVNKFRGNYAYVEDMMVDEEYRGRGIGKTLGKKLLSTARKMRVKTVELSTRPSRVAANKLYQSLGFVQKDTNVYRLKL